jgi:hypothetical protein
MSKKAVFTVVNNDNKHLDLCDIENISKDRIVKQYEIEYWDSEELNQQYEEARKVWDEYYVVVETAFFIKCSSHTYKEQVLMELNDDNF